MEIVKVQPSVGDLTLSEIQKHFPDIASLEQLDELLKSLNLSPYTTVAALELAIEDKKNQPQHIFE